MTTEPRCRACQLPLPPDAAACPRCGLEVGEAAPPPKPMPPTVRDFRRPTSRPEEMTQIVELPVGSLLPHDPPAAPAASPPPEKADHRAVALAIGLGLLTGALVILLIAGIVRSRQSPTPTAGTAAGAARP